MAQLVHRFSVMTRPQGWDKGKPCPKEEKVKLDFELTFSSEQALVEIAKTWIQTVWTHKWFQEPSHKDWAPGQLIKIDEKGNRSLTTEERVAMMSDSDRKALLEALLAAQKGS